MVQENRIILPHGSLTKLADRAGVSERTCSMYLKGWFDDDVREKALAVREIAKKEFGGVEQVPSCHDENQTS